MCSGCLCTHVCTLTLDKPAAQAPSSGLPGAVQAGAHAPSGGLRAENDGCSAASHVLEASRPSEAVSRSTVARCGQAPPRAVPAWPAAGWPARPAAPQALRQIQCSPTPSAGWQALCRWQRAAHREGRRHLRQGLPGVPQAWQRERCTTLTLLQAGTRSQQRVQRARHLCRSPPSEHSTKGSSRPSTHRHVQCAWRLCISPLSEPSDFTSSAPGMWRRVQRAWHLCTPALLAGAAASSKCPACSSVRSAPCQGTQAAQAAHTFPWWTATPGTRRMPTAVGGPYRGSHVQATHCGELSGACWPAQAAQAMRA